MDSEPADDELISTRAKNMTRQSREELLLEFYQDDGIDEFEEFTVVHYEDSGEWEGRWDDGRTDSAETLPEALEALADEVREQTGGDYE